MKAPTFHKEENNIEKKIKKTVEPVVDKIVHYYDDENGNLVRSRQDTKQI